MFFWLGLNLSPEFCQLIFGVQSVQQFDAERNQLPVFDNKLSQRVRGIIDAIQASKNRCMRVSLMIKVCLRSFLLNFNHNFSLFS